MAIAELVMPKLGESIMEATILKWHKQVGDRVQLDETVLEIATDKVDSEVPSTAAGVITELLFNVNDVVPIGTIIAKIETGVAEAPANHEPVFAPTVERQDPVAVAPAAQLMEKEAPAAELPAEEVPYVPNAVEIPSKPSGARFYSPLVLNIANSEGISLSELERIPGSGNEGRVTKKDILQYIQQKKEGHIPVYTAPQTTTTIPVQPAITTVPAVAPVALPYSGRLADPSQVTLSGNTEIIEMDRMRRLIAKHMVDSKHTSPNVTSFAEADVTNMVLWRERVKKDFEQREGTKLTFTPMFIECVVNVIKRFPLVNCSLDGDKIIIKKDVNIGMATALPNGNLIVPVIKGADQLNVVGLSKAVNNLADAARNNRLKPDDTNGGTFTLTNVGTFGSLMGTPIINQPQVAILAVGAIKKRPMVIESPAGDTIGIRHMMYLSLSYDHRIVDGSIGASFLTEVAKEFEKWDVNKQWFHYV